MRAVDLEEMDSLYAAIREELAALPEVAEWPQLLELADDLGGGTPELPFWEYPVVACQAAGADPATALPAAGAIFCLVASIRLVDDMLDEEEEAPYRTLGAGPTANLALAFQAAAARSTLRNPPPGLDLAAVQAEIASMALETAHGQHLDVTSPGGEDAYWAVAAAKTPPLVQGGLALGALYGGLPESSLGPLRDFGRCAGLVVQLNDDLADAMEATPAPDWGRPRSNLALLYALEADHPDRARFRELVDRVEDPSSLEEAKRILVRSGAVSYCAMHLARLHREGRSSLEAVRPPSPGPLIELQERLIAPLERLLRLAGVDQPAGFLAGT